MERKRTWTVPKAGSSESFQPGLSRPGVPNQSAVRVPEGVEDQGVHVMLQILLCYLYEMKNIQRKLLLFDQYLY